MKKTKAKKIKDIKATIKRQKTWATEAEKEAKAAKQRVKRDKKAGNKFMEKDDKREAKDDAYWAKKRRGLVKKYTKALPKQQRGKLNATKKR
jgi:hypothetical protein